MSDSFQNHGFNIITHSPLVFSIENFQNNTMMKVTDS